MAKFYSPSGNFEVWDTKPDGYYTEDEWAALHPAPDPPEPTKEEKRQALIMQYQSDKQELHKQLMDALLYDDATEQAEIRADLTALNESFDKAIAELEG